MFRFILAVLGCVYCVAVAAQSDSAPAGIAPFVELNREAFLMALYVPGRVDSAQDAFRRAGARALELKFTAERITAGKLSRLFLQSIAINATPQEQRASANALALFFNNLKGSLRYSDVLTISEKTNASGVLIYLNGHTLADIDDAGFFDLLLKAWIGAVPPNTEFKRALLGDYRPEDLIRYRAISPSQARRAAVAAWLVPEPEPATELTEVPVKATEDAAEPEPQTVPQADPGIAPQSPAVSEVAEKDVTEVTPPVQAAPEPPAAEVEEDLPNFSPESLTALQDYTARLVQLTHANIEYPRRAVQLKQTGSVRMGVIINREGRIMDVQPLLSSGYKQLDRAVEKAIRRAEPYPALPETIAAEHFEFVFPITFMLEK